MRSVGKSNSVAAASPRCRVRRNEAFNLETAHGDSADTAASLLSVWVTPCGCAADCRLYAGAAGFAVTDSSGSFTTKRAPAPRSLVTARWPWWRLSTMFLLMDRPSPVPPLRYL